MTFGSRTGSSTLSMQAGEGKNLALADELLGEVGFEELNFLRERAGEFGLLHAFGID